MNCGVCGEVYDPGPKHHECNACRRDGFVDGCTKGWDTWDDGESAYWRHTSSSPRHKELLREQWLTQADLLERLPAALSDGRAHQKLMSNPALAPLRRLFR